MEPTDLTIRVLEQIRDSVQGTNARLEQGFAELGTRVTRVETRLEEGLEHLGKRVTRVEMRLETGILEVGKELRRMNERLDDRLELADRVQRCEQDIHELQVKSGLK